jgi:pre-60S factor REI1
LVLLRTEDVSSDDSSRFQESGVPKRKARRSHFKPQNDTRKSFESPSAETPSSNHSEDSHSEDEEEQFNPQKCLFCNSQATSLDVNMAHMSYAHSFFIPNAEYLIDLESLLSYLFIILSDFHECLYCGSIKSNKLAVQDHMRGKGHCKVDLEDEGHALKQFYDFAGDADSDKESQDVEEDVTLVPEEDELRLPLGKRLGHRSRARYFRQTAPARASISLSLPQKLPTEGEAEELPAVEIQLKDQRILMRAGTSSSMIGVPEVQRRALVAVEQKMMKIEARTRNEYEAHVQRKANQQKRFKAKSIGKKAGGLEKRLG